MSREDGDTKGGRRWLWILWLSGSFSMLVDKGGKGRGRKIGFQSLRQRF